MAPSPEGSRPVLPGLRKKLRLWLGIAKQAERIRKLEEWKNNMAISKEDLERLNAATSRIATRVAALLDKVDALGEGNDDEVRAQQKAEDLANASAELRPYIEQLEGLGADASEIVPEPTPDQVPVEPGPDVPPVENLDTVEEAPAEAPSETIPDVAPAEPGPAVGDEAVGGDAGGPGPVDSGETQSGTNQ